MANLVHNERAKLVANAFDRASTTCIAVGVLAPAAGAMLGQPLLLPWDAAIGSFVVWMVVAGILHIEARQTLETLQE